MQLSCQRLKRKPPFPVTAVKRCRSSYCPWLRNGTLSLENCLHLYPALRAAMTFWVSETTCKIQVRVVWVLLWGRSEKMKNEWYGKERDFLCYQQNNPYTQVNARANPCEFLVSWLLHMNVNMYDLHLSKWRVPLNCYHCYFDALHFCCLLIFILIFIQTLFQFVCILKPCNSCLFWVLWWKVGMESSATKSFQSEKK